MHCIGCNDTHPVKSGVRYNIVCSSSTLHNWRGNTSINQYAGDYMHCDFDTITGATIQDNMHSVHAQWGTSTRPVDILLISSVNNLGNGESVERIMERYVRFKDMVENIGLGDPTGKSTLAISTVIMPLRLSSFNTNRQAGGHVPWMNRTEDILELNKRIIDLNKQKTIAADG